MTKIVNYLEKIYNSGGTSVYVYIIAGGVALILILLLLLSFINKKDKKSPEGTEEELLPKKEKKSKKVKKLKKTKKEAKEVQTAKVIEEPIKTEEPIIKEEPTKENNTFSSVYVDVPNKEKPATEPVIEKPVVEPIIEKPVVEPVIEKPVVEQAEIIVPEIKVDNPVQEFKPPKMLDDLPQPNTNQKEAKLEDVKIEKNLDNKQEKTFNSKPQQTSKDDLPSLQTESLKEEPIVLEVDDIKSKLANISSNKESNDEKSLDELLKQMGVDNSPEIVGKKDEEDILLGK